MQHILQAWAANTQPAGRLRYRHTHGCPHPCRRAIALLQPGAALEQLHLIARQERPDPWASGSGAARESVYDWEWTLDDAAITASRAQALAEVMPAGLFRLAQAVSVAGPVQQARTVRTSCADACLLRSTLVACMPGGCSCTAPVAWWPCLDCCRTPALTCLSPQTLGSCSGPAGLRSWESRLRCSSCATCGWS